LKMPGQPQCPEVLLLVILCTSWAHANSTRSPESLEAPRPPSMATAQPKPPFFPFRPGDLSEV
ncbi:hypothetical protein P7K49_024731, partial [Saguinus oedipus]